MELVSLSAPVTVQLKEYVDPATGTATRDSTLTVMVVSGYFYIALIHVLNYSILSKGSYYNRFHDYL